MALDDDCDVVDQLFWADTLTDARRWGRFGAQRPVKVSSTDLGSQVRRLDLIAKALQDFLVDSSGRVPVSRVDHAAMENYSLARKAWAHALGEVGGAVKLELWNARVPFRVYDVQAVKIFATGAGNATKTQMIDAVRDRWGQDWRRYGRRDEGSAGNLADAYTIARMLWTELRVRSGEIYLGDLPDEERRVFLRTTKQSPINVLLSDFVVAED